MENTGTEMPEMPELTRQYTTDECRIASGVGHTPKSLYLKYNISGGLIEMAERERAERAERAEIAERERSEMAERERVESQVSKKKKSE
jgi:hypothetical protein